MCRGRLVTRRCLLEGGPELGLWVRPVMELDTRPPWGAPSPVPASLLAAGGGALSHALASHGGTRIDLNSGKCISENLIYSECPWIIEIHH